MLSWITDYVSMRLHLMQCLDWKDMPKMLTLLRI